MLGAVNVNRRVPCERPTTELLSMQSPLGLQRRGFASVLYRKNEKPMSGHELEDGVDEVASPEKNIFIVVEVPIGASADATERALNEPYNHGYYLATFIPPEKSAVRAVYRLRAKSAPRKDENEAVAFLEANPKLTAREAIYGMAASGIQRTEHWVNLTRATQAYRAESGLNVPDKTTMSWSDWRGKEISREVNLTLDIRDFEGRPGYVWLFLAANCHLSYADIQRCIELQGDEDMERSRSWFQRRRWLFENPEKASFGGTKPNADGQDGRAIKIMRENPGVSARKLSQILRGRGIYRGKDWVLKNRCR